MKKKKMKKMRKNKKKKNNLLKRKCIDLDEVNDNSEKITKQNIKLNINELTGGGVSDNNNDEDITSDLEEVNDTESNFEESKE